MPETFSQWTRRVNRLSDLDYETHMSENLNQLKVIISYSLESIIHRLDSLEKTVIKIKADHSLLKKIDTLRTDVQSLKKKLSKISTENLSQNKFLARFEKMSNIYEKVLKMNPIIEKDLESAIKLHKYSTMLYQKMQVQKNTPKYKRMY